MAVYVSRIGIINGELESFAAQRDIIVADADRFATEQSTPLIAERDELAKAVAAYCEAHRSELIDNKTKTVKLPSGEISWRFTPPSVGIKNTTAVIAAIKERCWGKRFLRVKVEINRQALRDDPKRALTIPGVSIGRKEELIIKPNQGGEIVGKSTKV
jgi:phage host-nuclease inhibitor protein Gam